jgi:hypothetical protein
MILIIPLSPGEHHSRWRKKIERERKMVESKINKWVENDKLGRRERENKNVTTGMKGLSRRTIIIITIVIIKLVTNLRYTFMYGCIYFLKERSQKWKILLNLRFSLP